MNRNLTQIQLEHLLDHLCNYITSGSDERDDYFNSCVENNLDPRDIEGHAMSAIPHIYAVVLHTMGWDLNIKDREIEAYGFQKYFSKATVKNFKKRKAHGKAKK